MIYEIINEKYHSILSSLKAGTKNLNSKSVISN